MATAIASVKDARLTPKQDALLHALERRVQLRAHAERNALRLLDQQQQQHDNNNRSNDSCSDADARRHDDTSTAAAAMTVKAFLARRIAPAAHTNSSTSSSGTGTNLHTKTTSAAAATLTKFAQRIDDVTTDWHSLYSHALDAFALVDDMEASHAQVATKTQALYDSFETVLQQIETLTARHDTIAAPLPHFVAIERVANAIGYGVKFAGPNQTQTTNQNQMAVQVYPHRQSVDPTTAAFDDALTTIDASVAYLEQHLEYRDAACYISAYRTLAAGAIHCLKEYALHSLDAARDAVLDAVARTAVHTKTALEIDETAPFYVHFQLVAPALAAVATQLERFVASSQPASVTNAAALRDVCDMYATHRVQLLTSALATAFETTSHTTDIVDLLRVSCALLVRVCAAEFRLFTALFGRAPSDRLFVPRLHASRTSDTEPETAFDHMMLQLSSVLYNVVRPRMLHQNDLEHLCEVIHVLQTEVLESQIRPVVTVVGAVEPVMHRMVQDAQERLILCVQKYIRDAIDGFVATPDDLDYPNKLVTNATGSMYATWYPTLERTLVCLAKVYHFVNTEIFDELAHEAIDVCTATLLRAADTIKTARSAVDGALFLVQHLLTLREQLTPFDVTFARTDRALAFATSADALSHVLAGVSTLFSLSSRRTDTANSFSELLPQIEERTLYVKKELELALKRSCAAFIEAALEVLAQPLLALMKQLAARQIHAKTAQTPIDVRELKAIEPAAVANVLASVSTQLRDQLPDLRATIHLYLRNASTEAILFRPVQRNLIDAVESLQLLLEQTFAPTKRAASDVAFQHLLAQLRAL